MSKRIYTVYKTTNIINNKIYIGKHATKNPNDDYIGSGIAIKRAIKKHGKSNFTKEILFTYNTEKEAYLKESQIVDKKFINRPDTYNMISGGKGAGCGELNHMYGKKISDETRKKISDAGIGRSPSKETRKILSKNLSIRQIGKGNHQFQGYFITPWGKFETSQLASNGIDVSDATLRVWCKNNNSKITTQTLGCSKYLKSLPFNPKGKTFKSLGFSFICKNGYTYKQTIISTKPKYTYITPWGEFDTVKESIRTGVTNAMIRNWCVKYNNIQLTKWTIIKSLYFKNKQHLIGKTFNELGFRRILNE